MILSLCEKNVNLLTLHPLLHLKSNGGEGNSTDEGLYPHPSPKIKAFWERGIMLLKIRGDTSALRFAHPAKLLYFLTHRFHCF